MKKYIYSFFISVFFLAGVLLLNACDTAEAADIAFRVQDNYIQWSYDGEDDWTNVISLEDITGPSGEDGTNGTDGREVEFNVTATHLEWRYVGETNWTSFIALSLLEGADGREVEFQTSDTDLEWRYVGDTEWTSLLKLADLKGQDGVDGEDGAPGVDGREVEFQVTDTHLEWRYVGETTWTALFPLSDLTPTDGQDGVDGREVEFSTDDTSIVWRYIGDTDWISLVQLDTLVGASGQDGTDGIDGTDGVDGREVEFQTSGMVIEWRYVGDDTWMTLYDLSTLSSSAVVLTDVTFEMRTVTQEDASERMELFTVFTFSDDSVIALNNSEMFDMTSQGEVLSNIEDQLAYMLDVDSYQQMLAFYDLQQEIYNYFRVIDLDSMIQNGYDLNGVWYESVYYDTAYEYELATLFTWQYIYEMNYFMYGDNYPTTGTYAALDIGTLALADSIFVDALFSEETIEYMVTNGYIASDSFKEMLLIHYYNSYEDFGLLETLYETEYEQDYLPITLVMDHLDYLEELQTSSFYRFAGLNPFTGWNMNNSLDLYEYMYLSSVNQLYHQVQLSLYDYEDEYFFFELSDIYQPWMLGGETGFSKDWFTYYEGFHGVVGAARYYSIPGIRNWVYDGEFNEYYFDVPYGATFPLPSPKYFYEGDYYTVNDGGTERYFILEGYHTDYEVLTPGNPDYFYDEFLIYSKSNTFVTFDDTDDYWAFDIDTGYNDRGNYAVRTLFVYANWTEVYLVNFYDDDGLIETQVVKSGESATAPDDVYEPFEYYFDDWDTDFTNVTSNLDVYAMYLPYEYDITYNLDGGTNDPSNPTTFSADDPATLAPATKDGYTFDGWYLDSDFSGEPLTELSAYEYSDVTLYAKWVEFQYTITYMDGDTEIIPVNNPETFGVSELNVQLTGEDKEGYTFDGWYSNPEFGGFVFEQLSVAQDYTLYGKWTPINYAVTRIYSGTGSGNVTVSGRPNINETMTVTITPDEGSNYAGFKVYYLDANGEPVIFFTSFSLNDTFTMVAEDIIIDVVFEDTENNPIINELTDLLTAIAADPTGYTGTLELSGNLLSATYASSDLETNPDIIYDDLEAFLAALYESPNSTITTIEFDGLIYTWEPLISGPSASPAGFYTYVTGEVAPGLSPWGRGGTRLVTTVKSWFDRGNDQANLTMKNDDNDQFTVIYEPEVQTFNLKFYGANGEIVELANLDELEQAIFDKNKNIIQQNGINVNDLEGLFSKVINLKIRYNPYYLIGTDFMEGRGVRTTLTTYQEFQSYISSIDFSTIQQTFNGNELDHIRFFVDDLDNYRVSFGPYESYDGDIYTSRPLFIDTDFLNSFVQRRMTGYGGLVEQLGVLEIPDIGYTYQQFFTESDSLLSYYFFAEFKDVDGTVFVKQYITAENDVLDLYQAIQTFITEKNVDLSTVSRFGVSIDYFLIESNSSYATFDDITFYVTYDGLYDFIPVTSLTVTNENDIMKDAVSSIGYTSIDEYLEYLAQEETDADMNGDGYFYYDVYFDFTFYTSNGGAHIFTKYASLEDFIYLTDIYPYLSNAFLMDYSELYQDMLDQFMLPPSIESFIQSINGVDITIRFEEVIETWD